MLLTPTDATSIRSLKRSRSNTPQQRRSSSSPRRLNSAAVRRAMNQNTPAASPEVKTRADPANMTPVAVPSSLPQTGTTIPSNNAVSPLSLDDTLNEATSVRPPRRKRRGGSSEGNSSISEVSTDNHPMAIKRQQTERLPPILSEPSTETLPHMSFIPPEPIDDTVSLMIDPYNSENMAVTNRPLSTMRKSSVASVRTNSSTAFLSPNSAYYTHPRTPNPADRPTPVLRASSPPARSELSNHKLALEKVGHHHFSARKRTYTRSKYFGSSHKTIFSVLALFFPPAAVWFALGHWQGGVIGLNVLLTLCGWIPGVVHAI